MGSALSTVWRKLHEPRVHLTVEPVLFLFMFASFLSYTLFQELVHHLVCEQTDNCSSNASSETHFRNGTARGCNEPSGTEQLVQTTSSHWLLYINLATGLPSVLVSVFYGSISDHKGRRPFIILPAVGAILNQVVILLVVYFQDSLPLAFLLLGAFASGICGSYSVINFAVYSYASDVSAQSKRTLQISVLESMTYLGATASLVIGGLWVSSGHYAGPLLCIISINVAIIVYSVVGLPESLGAFHRDDDSRPSPRQSLDVRQLLKAACHSLVSFARLLAGTWRLVVLIVMFLVVEINFLGITDTVILFALGEPLCWGPELIGYFLAAKVLLNGVATLFVLPVLSYCGVRDTTVLVVGLVAGASSLTLMGFATHTWLMFVVPAVAAMRGCVVPCIRSMASKLTPGDKQGVLFSGLSVVESSCTLLASVIYNALYPITREIAPGLIFFLMAAALVIPLGLTTLLELSNWQCCCRTDQRGRGEREPLLQIQ